MNTMSAYMRISRMEAQAVSSVISSLPLYTNAGVLEAGDLARYPWMKANDSVVRILSVEFFNETHATINYAFTSGRKPEGYFSMGVCFGTQFYGDIKPRWYKRTENYFKFQPEFHQNYMEILGISNSLIIN